MQTPLIWGFTKGFGMLAAGLCITLLLGMMLQSRAETRQAFSAASGRNLALASDPLLGNIPKEKFPRVEFTPEFVSGR